MERKRGLRGWYASGTRIGGEGEARVSAGAGPVAAGRLVAALGARRPARDQCRRCPTLTHGQSPGANRSKTRPGPPTEQKDEATADHGRLATFGSVSQIPQCRGSGAPVLLPGIHLVVDVPGLAGVG